MQFSDEFFGSEAQQTVSRNARDILNLCPDDPRFSYNGRIMTVVGYQGPKTNEILTSLARLQGSATCHFLPKEKANSIKTEIEADGLATNIWEFCEARETAYEAAKEILKQHELPADIVVERLSVDTDASRVKDFAAMAADCGVLAMCGRVMRGLDVPGITLAGIDQTGAVIASAWGYKCYHPKSEFSDYAFWGGLSCREDRRGQKIALVLGALTIVQLWEELQVRGFVTGVTQGNEASFSVCKKLGLLPAGRIGLGVTNPAMFKGTTLTK